MAFAIAFGVREKAFGDIPIPILQWLFPSAWFRGPQHWVLNCSFALLRKTKRAVSLASWVLARFFIQMREGAM